MKSDKKAGAMEAKYKHWALMIGLVLMSLCFLLIAFGGAGKAAAAIGGGLGIAFSLIHWGVFD